MRKLIAGFKISLDGKIESTAGYADWVAAWSEDYGLTPEIDACLLGGAMYPGYEGYWSALAAAPEAPHPMTGKLPSAGELAWSEFAAITPHFVLSKQIQSVNWPHTKLLNSLDDIRALKQQDGKAIYLMGGAQLANSLINAGLVDEIRLIIYPLFVGEGKTLFSTIVSSQSLELKAAKTLDGGLVALRYAIHS